MGNIEKEQRGYTFQDPWYNPSGWAWLSRNIGPDPLKYSILYRWLLRPVDSVVEKAERFIKEHRLRQRYVIALHIRARSNTVKGKVASDDGWTPYVHGDADVEEFFEGARRLGDEFAPVYARVYGNGTLPTERVFLILTDNGGVTELAYEHFNRSRGEEVIAFGREDHAGFRRSTADVLHDLSELFTAGAANLFLGTMSSSYSCAASAHTGILQHVLQFDESKPKGQKAVLARYTSTTPYGGWKDRRSATPDKQNFPECLRKRPELALSISQGSFGKCY